MLLEMCAFRVLTTTFGSSIHVTGVLLALVMVALAGGYWLGGRASRRSTSIAPLLVILAGVTAYVVVTGIWLVEPILDRCFALRRSIDDVLLRDALPPSIVTLVLYAVPMTGLSQVSPFLIRVLAASTTAAPLARRARARRGRRALRQARGRHRGQPHGDLHARQHRGTLLRRSCFAHVGRAEDVVDLCGSMALVVGAGRP